MELTKHMPSTASEYINCFRQLSAITNAGLDYYESKNDWVSEDDKNRSLRRLAESIQTISLLRGDGGAFTEFRPDGLIEYQTEMYRTEDYLRNRLQKLGYIQTKEE